MAENQEVIEEVKIDTKNPFTPGLSYVEWLKENKLKTHEDVVKFVDKLDLSKEEKEFVKKDIKHII
jgi:hypothetical protein